MVLFEDIVEFVVRQDNLVIADDDVGSRDMAEGVFGRCLGKTQDVIVLFLCLCDQLEIQW